MNYQSAHYNGKLFQNPVPTQVMQGSYAKLIGKLFQKHPGREPVDSPGPFAVDYTLLHALPPDALRITWMGHSSIVLEIEGKRLLCDPLWCQRASPFGFMGPKRFFDNPLDFDKLPPIDALLLSHDHYDHLDKTAVLKLAAKKIPVITMLGVGKRLQQWGIDPSRIIELDWWQTISLDHLSITSAPTRHFSGRWINDRNHTLWGSFAIKGNSYNVYFGADSGYYDGFKTIGEKLGPFDLTMLEIGAYGDQWPDIHMGPINAVQAHKDVQGNFMFPIHWGTFNLAFHPWKEPVEQLLPVAAENNIPLILPTPGETYDVSKGAHLSRWWQAYQ